MERKSLTQESFERVGKAREKAERKVGLDTLARVYLAIQGQWYSLKRDIEFKTDNAERLTTEEVGRYNSAIDTMGHLGEHIEGQFDISNTDFQSYVGRARKRETTRENSNLRVAS